MEHDYDEWDNDDDLEYDNEAIIKFVIEDYCRFLNYDIVKQYPGIEEAHLRETMKNMHVTEQGMINYAVRCIYRREKIIPPLDKILVSSINKLQQEIMGLKSEINRLEEENSRFRGAAAFFYFQSH